MGGGPRDLLLKALFKVSRRAGLCDRSLDRELDHVRTWPALLAGAPLAKLVTLGTDVAALMTQNRHGDHGAREGISGHGGL